MKYKEAQMITKVRRPVAEEESANEFAGMISDSITWRGDSIEAVLKATMCDHVVEPGDKITITIEIAKEASSG
jgi:hypothetical protein